MINKKKLLNLNKTVDKAEGIYESSTFCCKVKRLYNEAKQCWEVYRNNL